MGGPDQAGLVGIVADRLEIDVDALAFEQHGRAADGQLTDPAAAEAATDDETFSIAPFFRGAGIAG